MIPTANWSINLFKTSLLVPILIADSGATKTKWGLCDSGKILASYTTIGMNPNAVSTNLIQADLLDLKQKLKSSTFNQIFFYGSGMNSSVAQAKMYDLLGGVFEGVPIFVENDLLGAARSTGRKQGAIGILGTGSIACWYEEGEIVRQKGGHGYLVGDEGSGQDLGKHLLRGLLYETLPVQIRTYVMEQEQKSPLQLRTELYQNQRPSAFLASLARHLGPFQKEPYIRQLIRERFDLFLQTNVLPLGLIAQTPLDMVGSIAYYFSDIWRNACSEASIKLGNIYQDPLPGLAFFHK